MTHVHLQRCASTQDEVRARLTDTARGTVVSVSCDDQFEGRGREGRRWQTPPGSAVLLSVGCQGPLPVAVLDDLPRRAADGVLAAVGSDAAQQIAWKAPNDLVAVDGAKLAGILVDARTTGGDVDHVIVGLGLNATGAAFTTHDGRSAATLEQLTGHAVDVDELIARLVAALSDLLGSAPSARR